jgi:quinoprotein relay system zinc metallohydrolase 2
MRHQLSAYAIRRRDILGALGAAVVPRATRSARAAGLTLTEVAPGVHVRPGLDEDAGPANDDAIANIGCIVGDACVAVIDPGGSQRDGRRLRAAIRAVTDRPIRYVILSHVHPDHIFGSPAFEVDAPVFVGHARLPGALLERGDFYRRTLRRALGADAPGDYVLPTMTVADTAEIDLGGRVLQVRAHGAAHTDTDLSVLDRRTGTLWAADLLFVQRIPSLDGSLLGWLHELDVLKAMPAIRAVPGHGPASVPWPGGAADEERYLRALLRDTRTLLATGGDIASAPEKVAQSERDRWALFDAYNGHNATVAFKELEWE